MVWHYANSQLSESAVEGDSNALVLVVVSAKSKRLVIKPSANMTELTVDSSIVTSPAVMMLTNDLMVVCKENLAWIISTLLPVNVKVGFVDSSSCKLNNP